VPENGDIVCSVVIPAYNGAGTIGACVNSVLGQEFPKPFEVIVVDSSSDGTPAIIRRRFPKVKLIHLDKQTPEGEARNIGVESARGEFIAMTDQDCVVPRDWLARIEAHLRRNDYAAVGGCVNPSPGDDWFARGAFLAEFSGFLRGDWPGVRRSVPTCNIAYRARVFRDGLRFPGAIPISEDLVFNHALSRRGERVYFDPEIAVTHLNRQGLRAAWTHMRYLGMGSARSRRMQPGLPGGLLLRRPWLTFALPFYRWLAVTWRLVRLSPVYMAAAHIYAIPIFVSLIAWTVGFREGLKGPAGARPERAQP
jgi:glycosyltransferase involved in cell wall biosynthesis